MKKPNGLLFWPLGALLKVFAYFKGQRIVKRTKIKGPAITLSNHTSFYDFIYTTTALYPYRMNYLAAHKMFFDPLLGPFLRMSRAIPKALLQPDVVATIKALRVLKKGGILSIFPEGQISPTGRFMMPAFAIAKLIKKAKVDVLTVKHQFPYLVNPPWTKKTFKGKMITTVDKLIDKNDIPGLSEEVIYDLVVKGLTHSPYQSNLIMNYTYKLNDIHGLEYVLTECPNCHQVGMKSEKHELHCPHCDTKLTYDKYGRLDGKGVETYYEAQRERLIETIKNNPDYALESPVKLEGYDDQRVKTIGEGHLKLSKEGYHFEGVVHGQPTTYHFEIKDVPTCPSDIGRNIQIYEGYQLYQFVFENPYLPTQFVLLGEVLYENERSSTKLHP